MSYDVSKTFVIVIFHYRLCAMRILYIDLSFCLGTIVCHVSYIAFYVMDMYIMMSLGTCALSIPINILYNAFFICILYGVLQPHWHAPPGCQY